MAQQTLGRILAMLLDQQRHIALHGPRESSGQKNRGHPGAPADADRVLREVPRP
jgi:hypothetical protein